MRKSEPTQTQPKLLFPIDFSSSQKKTHSCLIWCQVQLKFVFSRINDFLCIFIFVLSKKQLKMRGKSIKIMMNVGIGEEIVDMTDVWGHKIGPRQKRLNFIIVLPLVIC